MTKKPEACKTPKTNKPARKITPEPRITPEPKITPEIEPDTTPENENKNDNENRGRKTRPKPQMRPNKHQRRKRQRKKAKSTISSLKILYANANGIRSKMTSLENAAKLKSAQIICITETKGKPPTIPGYSEWHTGGRKEGGGGVAIAVREDLTNNTQPIDDIEDNDQEIAWIRINGAYNNKISVGVYYGKQESDPADEVEREFSQIMTQIIKLKQQGPVILTGDFNAKIQIIKEHITQNPSRNGHILQNLIDELELIPVSTRAEDGTWTWEKRTNENQKSVIDYILISQDLEDLIVENSVDSKGTFRLKGRKESDHNSMFIKANLPLKKESELITKWKLSNDQAWDEFNKEMKKTPDEAKKNYDLFEAHLHKTMKKTLGETKIRIGEKRKTKTSKATKDAKEKMKKARKEFNQAIKKKTADLPEKKDKYIDAQIELKREIEKDTMEEINNKIQKIIQEGGVKSNLFWKTKRGIMKNEGSTNYTTIDEEGAPIEDPDKAKKYIADYYESLYHARGSRPGYEEISNKISEKVKEIEKSETMKAPPAPVTIKEVEEVIKTLKNGKAPGPDNIPNEIFKKADKETVKIYTEVIENINKNKEIPKQWQKGKIIRLYKGKGKRGKCSNERGITKSSNMGKLYERIINNRILEHVTISEDQAGGKKGSSTSDHIALLNETIYQARKMKKKVYITFLDVTKAYDKAWLDAILYVLNKEGLETPEWIMIKKLNENLTATIQTKHGETREINITDSIRQGGVLSVIEYATLMDEISKEIKKKDLGIYIPSIDEKIGCLLWMDDALMITTDPVEHQEMLDITDEVAGVYHVEFGDDKSKNMLQGSKKDRPVFHIGDMILGQCEKYKYLGAIKNDKNNMKDHIKALKSKVEAAYQTILAITGNRDLADIEMESIWALVECTIIPIITYACETWNLNSGEEKEINSIMDNVIKRILMMPQKGTTRESLYIETGLLDPTTIQHKQRIMMNYRNTYSTNQRLKKLATSDEESLWKTLVETSCEKLQIWPAELIDDKWIVKSKVKEKAHEYFKNTLENDAREKSKVQFLLNSKDQWKPGNRAPYLNKLTRKDCNTIFRTRTRMIDVKNNFRSKYPNLSCRACKNEPETQEHVLNECPTIHPKNDTKVTTRDVFNEDPANLKVTAKKIRAALDKLDEPDSTAHQGNQVAPPCDQGCTQ